MLQMRTRRPREEETLQGPLRERQGHARRPGLPAPCPREVSHLHELRSRLLHLALQLGDDLCQPGKLPDAPGLEFLPALCELLLQLRQLAQQVLLPLPQELVALLKLSHDALPLVLELLLQGGKGEKGVTPPPWRGRPLRDPAWGAHAGSSPSLTPFMSSTVSRLEGAWSLPGATSFPQGRQGKSARSVPSQDWKPECLPSAALGKPVCSRAL